MATRQELHGHFRQVSGSVQQKYGEITDSEIEQTEGNLQKLIGLIQEKTGESREQVETYVRDLSDRAKAGYQASTRLVAERPTESVLGAFVIGMATGVVLGLSLASARRPAPSWRNAWRG